MASSYLGNLGSLGLGMDRFMADQPANLYDPNQFINPMMLPYLQPQMMRQMANFQNPQLMLPQNSGAFLSQAIGKMMGLGQYSPQAQSSQAPQGQQQSPTQQLQQQIYSKRNALIQGGMQAGQAQYLAAQDLMGNPAYADSGSQAILGRFMSDAQKNLGYDPKIAQTQQYQYQNYMNTKTGQQASLNSLQYAHLPDRQDWIKSENTPQMAPGRIQQNLENGKYVLRQTTPDGTQRIIGTSSSPMQFIQGRNVNLTGQDITNNPSLLDSTTTGSSADITRRNIAEQQSHVQNAISIGGDISSLLQQGASGGTAGDWFEKIDNGISTIGQMADRVGDTKAFDKYVMDKNANMGQMGSIITRFKLSGQQAQTLNTALNAYAYEYWRAQNPNGRLTPKELTEARDEIIGDNADPNAIMGSIGEANRIMQGNLSRTQQISGQGNFGPPPKNQANTAVPEDISALVSKYGGVE